MRNSRTLSTHLDSSTIPSNNLLLNNIRDFIHAQYKKARRDDIPLTNSSLRSKEFTMSSMLNLIQLNASNCMHDDIGQLNWHVSFNENLPNSFPTYVVISIG